MTKKNSAYQLNVGNYFTDTAPVLPLHDTSSALVGVVSNDQAALAKQVQQLNEQYQTLHSLQQQLEKRVRSDPNDGRRESSHAKSKIKW